MDEHIFDKVQDVDLKKTMETNYVNYAMSVIVARAVRYFLIVITAGTFWPLSFKFFAKLRIPFMDKFTLWLKGKVAKK